MSRRDDDGISSYGVSILDVTDPTPLPVVALIPSSKPTYFRLADGSPVSIRTETRIEP